MATQRSATAAAAAAQRFLSRPPHRSVCGRSLLASNQCTFSALTGDVVDNDGSATKARRFMSTDASLGPHAVMDEYVSPYKDFFDMIDSGRTSLGTDATKPYEMPELKYLECGVPEHTLRFIAVSYGRHALPPYIRPDEFKVTMEVSMEDVPIEGEMEWKIFKQIVGQRYKAEKNLLKLVSTQFASRIENKRHLESMLNRIVFSTKRLAKEALDKQLMENS